MFVQEAFPATICKSLRSSRSLQQYLFNLLQSANTVRKTTQIHAQIIINAFTHRNFIIVKLLDSYISAGYLHQAHQAFERINNPSSTSWNQIIRGYAGTNMPRVSIDLFDEMWVSEAVPDEHTYCYVISACARGKLLRLGEKFHGRVLARGFGSNLFLQTNLVNLYAVAGGVECDGVKNARKVFDGMSERNVVTWTTLLAGYVKCHDLDGACRVFDEMPERDAFSWTVMVSGYAHNGGCKKAVSLFYEMVQARMELDQVTLTAALSACAEIGDLKTGRCIHSYVNRIWNIADIEHLVPLNNSLIHMYASCGVTEDAYKVFKRMRVRSTVSWTTMIMAFAKQGRGENALSVFEWMQNAEDRNAKPDTITMLAVLYACSHSGLVDQGRHFFKNMNSIWGIEPTIEHYGCMVDLLCRAGLLVEAHELVKTMPMEPNDAIWGSLLGGCRIHKKVELAYQIVQKLATMELEDDKAAGYLVLLSNIYASAKRWKDVVNVREQIYRLGLRKPPGRSWVQVNGSAVEFVAGDTTHSHTCLIYDIIELVTSEAELAGYNPDILEAQIFSIN